MPYEDKGTGVLSDVPSADFHVITATGNYSDMIGRTLIIHFDNNLEN